MEERRNELLAVQETISAAKNAISSGRTLEVMVDGSAEESTVTGWKAGTRDWHPRSTGSSMRSMVQTSPECSGSRSR